MSCTEPEHGVEAQSVVRGQALRERVRQMLPKGLVRRFGASLANRILLLQLGWAIAVYLMVSAGLWWGTVHIIEQSLHRQAAGWLAKADELGTPLYASQERAGVEASLKSLANIPEIISVHYFDASGSKLVYEYWREKGAAPNSPVFMTEEIAGLQHAPGASKPILFHKEAGSIATFRASAPVWIKSLRSDGLLDFSLEETAQESVKTIGYISMRLDYGRLVSDFVKNVLWVSAIIAMLLLAFLLFGQFIIRWALRPLTQLEAPLVRLASGDTSIQVESSGDREIAQIGRALNTTINAVRERDEMLRRMANQDALTGLANRSFFDEALQAELQRVIEGGGSSALLFIDLDRFKHINDRYGHATGDRLLVQVAELLRGRMREHDLVARFGGDEFMVLVRDVDIHAAMEIAASLIGLMQNFYFHQAGESLRIYFSIGVAMIDPTSQSAHEVLLHADAAASEAKRRGRNRFEMYAAQDAALSDDTAGWRGRLQRCLNDDALVLNFQPVIDVSDGSTCHYEVLVRMPDGGGRMIAPSAFMADAERYGMMADVDRQVVRKTAEVMAQQGNDMFSINLSAHTLQDSEFPRYLSSVLAEHQVAASRLLVEIAEQELVHHFEQVRQQMEALVAAGVNIIIDDFGAGLSSLAYLKRCPVSYVKIDSRVINAAADDKIDQVAIKAIVEAAASRGIRNVAKFVQNQAALDLLRELGIEYAQSYFLAPPAALAKPIVEQRASAGA